MNELQKLEKEHEENNKWLDEHSITYTDQDSKEKDSRRKRRDEYIEVLTPMRREQKRQEKLKAQEKLKQEQIKAAKDGLEEIEAFYELLLDFDTFKFNSYSRLLQEVKGEISKRKQIINS